MCDGFDETDEPGTTTVSGDAHKIQHATGIVTVLMHELLVRFVLVSNDTATVTADRKHLGRYGLAGLTWTNNEVC